MFKFLLTLNIKAVFFNDVLNEKLLVFLILIRLKPKIINAKTYIKARFYNLIKTAVYNCRIILFSVYLIARSLFYYFSSFLKKLFLYIFYKRALYFIYYCLCNII